MKAKKIDIKTKKIVIISCLILSVIVISLFLTTHYSKSRLNIQNQASKQDNILDVDNIAVDPSAYSGKITVRGAVSFVYLEQGSFAVIDIKEYDKCGVVTCAINHMVVSYSKQLPRVKDRVEIIGELIRTNQGYVLNAEDVKVE